MPSTGKNLDLRNKRLTFTEACSNKTALSESRTMKQAKPKIREKLCYFVSLDSV